MLKVMHHNNKYSPKTFTPYYKVTYNPRRVNILPLHKSDGLPALPLKSESSTRFTYVRFNIYPNQVQLAQLHRNRVNVYL